MKLIYIDIEKLKVLAEQGKSTMEMSQILGVSQTLIRNRMWKNGIKSRLKHKHTAEHKAHLSKLRKIFLQQNPDKHPWRYRNKFKSVPCETLKNWLRLNNFTFVEEFIVPETNFSIDIAFPDKKIGIEVNGNQHYNPDGTLKPYYQNRENIIQSFGWKLYQLHYSLCYKIDELSSLFQDILNLEGKYEFNYFLHIPKTKKEFCCLDCSKSISKTAKRCHKCARKLYLQRQFNPTKEELETLLKTNCINQIAKLYSVSFNLVKRRCKEHNLYSKAGSPTRT